YFWIRTTARRPSHTAIDSQITYRPLRPSMKSQELRSRDRGNPDILSDIGCSLGGRSSDCGHRAPRSARTSGDCLRTPAAAATTATAPPKAWPPPLPHLLPIFIRRSEPLPVVRIIPQSTPR